MASQPLDSNQQKRLEEILADYLQQLEEGKTPDRQELLDRYPELADPLRAFFSNHDHLCKLPSEFDVPAGPPSEPGDLAQPDVETVDVAESQAGKQTVKSETMATTPRMFGDYELLSEIARGGMGVVYKARQISAGRIVALKMILDQQLASSEEVQRFYAEAESAASLDHHHIVPIHQIGELDGQHYFTMKLIEGGNLAHRIKELHSSHKGRARFQESVRLLVTVAQAVHFAHQHGILHRDLKPGNILLDTEGEPYVTDFGLAKQINKALGLTQPGAILGTPCYMPPEQAMAKEPLTTAADVYSLGAILYEILTGKPPFRAATQLDILLQVIEKEPVRPRQLNRRIDRDLETICLKCLNKQPGKRYASAEALADDLERWLDSKPIRARRISIVGRTIKWTHRRPALASLVLLLALTPLFVWGGVSWQRIAAEQHRLAQEEARKQQVRQYYEGILQAQAALEENDKEKARNLLDTQCVPDLRCWEWYCLKKLCDEEPRDLTLSTEKGDLRQVGFSANGKHVVAVFENPLQLCVWEVSTGQETYAFEEKPSETSSVSVSQVALSSGGTQLAMAVPNSYRFVQVQRPVQMAVDPLTRIWKNRTPIYTPRPYIKPYIPRYGGMGGFPGSPYGLGGFGRSPFMGGSSYGPFMGMPPRSSLYSGLGNSWGSPSSFGMPPPYGPTGLFGQPWAMGLLDPYHGLYPYSPFALGGTGGLPPEVLFEINRSIQPTIYGPVGTPWMSPYHPLRFPVPQVSRQKQTIYGFLAIRDLVIRQKPVLVKSGMHRVAFSSDGKYLATSVDNSVSIRNVSDGKVATTLGQHEGKVNALVFSPDGTTLVSAGEGTIQFWDVASGRKLNSWEIPNHSTKHLVFGDDGRKLVSVTTKGAVMVWDIAAQKQIFTLEGNYQTARFTPDGKRLLLADKKGLVVAKADSGERVCELPGFQEKVESFVFRPNGTLVAAVPTKSDLTVHVWNVQQ